MMGPGAKDAGIIVKARSKVWEGENTRRGETLVNISKH